MNKMFVKEIRDRSIVESVFLVKDKITAMAKNGKPYLTLKLMDKTGEVEGRIWDNVESIGALFEKDDFVAVKSKASVYLGKMQLVVSDLKRVPEEEVALADFLPEAQRAIDEMLEELSTLIHGLSDENLRRLMLSFANDEAFMAKYRVAPAAKGMHHVYLGGLLEHSLSVARLVDAIVPLYGGLNRDLLIVGALLHDVGKVREMTYLRSFDYTDEGKLLGHITIGVEMIHERLMGMPDFPEQLGMLLKHMILSHHGQYEFGSPKRPKTVEATILNYLDDLDSKINGIRSHISKEQEGVRWTAYHRLYDRYYFMGENGPESRIVEEETVTVAEMPAPEPGPTSSPQREERKSFKNNPFGALGDTNLSLFK